MTNTDRSLEAAIEAMSNLPDDDSEVVEGASVDDADSAAAEEIEEFDAGAEDADSDITDSEADESAAEDEGEGDPEEDIAETEDASEVKPDEPAIEPPAFLDPTEREAFAKLPIDAKAIVQRHGKAMQADYTRKNMEVAEQRKAFEKRLEVLDDVVTEAEQRVRAWQSQDWVALSQKVSAEEYNQYRAQADKDVSEYQEFIQKRQVMQKQKLTDHQNAEFKAMSTVAPEFLDPVKGEKLLVDTINFMREQSIPEERILWATAPELSMFKDAMEYRKQIAQRGKKPVLRPKPDAKTTAKPVRSSARKSSSKKMSQAQINFNRNPSAANAQALMAEMD